MTSSARRRGRWLALLFLGTTLATLFGYGLARWRYPYRPELRPLSMSSHWIRA